VTTFATPIATVYHGSFCLNCDKEIRKLDGDEDQGWWHLATGKRQCPER
jgi:hypothetical protein